MKKRKHAEGISGLMKAVMATPLSKPAQRKKQIRRTGPAPEKEAMPSADAIGPVTPADLIDLAAPLVIPPPAPLNWTEQLKGFEDARKSAIWAIAEMWCKSKAYQAIIRQDGAIELFLHRVRCGLVAWNSGEITEVIKESQARGRSQILREIVEAFKTAGKRMPKKMFAGHDLSQELSSDINHFRLMFAEMWVCACLWLMPDNLIADFLHAFPVKESCDRSTVTKAVKAMHLVKHYDFSGKHGVKGFEKNFCFVFADGYPPASQHLAK